MRLSPQVLLALAAVAFVSLGLPDGLLGVAWPSMRAFFGLPLDALAPLLVAFTSGYVATSFAGGRLLTRLGLGGLLAASCAATGLSLLGYALAGQWWLVVALGGIAGLGAGGIDTGINTYAAERHGPVALNWLHACYGLGAAGGPAIMTAVLAAALPWQRGYAIVATGQLVLATAFAVTRRAWETPRPAAPGPRADPTPATPVTSTLRLPVAWLGIALFFAYTGLEMATGTWAYTILTEGRGLALTTAGPSVTAFWIGLTGGRVLGAAALRVVPVGRVLGLAVTLLAAALAVFAFHLATTSDLVALVLAGIAAGPIFPSLIATTPARVGLPHAANAIGFQIAAAALGQSLVPSALGALGRHAGLDAIPIGLVGVALVVVALFVGLQRSAATGSRAGALAPSPSA